MPEHPARGTPALPQSPPPSSPSLPQDWKPVLSITSIIYGLQYLFLDPNPDDPLNKEAAEMMRDNPRQFEQNVKRSIQGGQVAGTFFPSALAR